MVNFNGKSVLITGGAGFIGSNIAFFLQKNFPQCEITIFDLFNNFQRLENGNFKSLGNFKNLIGFRGKIICGDIAERSDLKFLDNSKYDYIFHQAAISDTRVYDQELIMRTNVNSFYYFLDKCCLDKTIMVYASSAATYGSLNSPQKIGKESPENPYGYSKYIMDQIANKYIQINKDLKIFGLRFFNVYGPKEFHKGKTSSMIIQLGHQILNNSNPRLFENSENIFRDFVYIEDVVKANILAASSSRSGIYNIGSGISRSFKDIVDILQNQLGTNLDIEYFKNPYSDYQMNTCADIFSSKKFLNFEPSFTLEDGIKSYISDIKETFLTK